jgi:hypothetical protein
MAFGLNVNGILTPFTEFETAILLKLKELVSASTKLGMSNVKPINEMPMNFKISLVIRMV